MKSKLKKSIEKRAAKVLAKIGKPLSIDVVAKALLQERRRALNEAIKTCGRVRCPGATPFDCNSDRVITFDEGRDECIVAITDLRDGKGK